MLLTHGPQIRFLRAIQISIYQTLILYIKKEKLAKKGMSLWYIHCHCDILWYIKFKKIKEFFFTHGDNEFAEIENKNSKIIWLDHVAIDHVVVLWKDLIAI